MLFISTNIAVWVVENCCTVMWAYCVKASCCEHAGWGCSWRWHKSYRRYDCCRQELLQNTLYHWQHLVGLSDLFSGWVSLLIIVITVSVSVALYNRPECVGWQPTNHVGTGQRCVLSAYVYLQQFWPVVRVLLVEALKTSVHYMSQTVQYAVWN